MSNEQQLTKRRWYGRQPSVPLCAGEHSSMHDCRSRQARRIPNNVASENLTYEYQSDSPSKRPSSFSFLEKDNQM